MDDQQERLNTALRNAQLAFWKSIAENYPEITSGDLDVGATIDFDDACETVVRQWLYLNSEGEKS